MARTGRPKAKLVLTDQERATLAGWSRRAKSSQALAQHSRPFIWAKTAEEIPESLARYCRQISGAGH